MAVPTTRLALVITFIFFLSKVYCYAGLRLLYPFSQFLARDWHLNTEQMGLILGITEFAAIPAGFLGFVGDRIGAAKLTAISYLGLCLCSGLMLLPPIFGVLLTVRFFFGFFRDLSMVAIQDYCCNLFQADKADRVTGALEMSYSVAALAGIPLLGLAYDAFDWKAPFILITVLLAMLLPVIGHILWRYPGPLPHSRLSVNRQGEEAGRLPIKRLGYLSGLQFYNGALAFNLSGFFLNIGANLLATELGILLSDVYMLDEAQSGTASIAMAVGELLGIFLTMLPCIKVRSFRTMRLSSFASFVLSIPFMVWGASALEATLVLLFVIFVFIEFSAVQRFARASQFAHKVDAIAMLGVNVQFQYAGRTIGAAVAGVMFESAGHIAVGAFAVACMFLTVVCLELGVWQKAKYDKHANEFRGVEFGEVTVV